MGDTKKQKKQKTMSEMFGLPEFAVICGSCKSDMHLLGTGRHEVIAVCRNNACPRVKGKVGELPNAVKVTAPFVLCSGA